MTEHPSLRHPEHKEFCNYNQYDFMLPDFWCNCGVGDAFPPDLGARTRTIPDLDLFYDERVPPRYRGRIRELAAQLVLGEITLGYFVDFIRGREDL